MHGTLILAWGQSGHDSASRVDDCRPLAVMIRTLFGGATSGKCFSMLPKIAKKRFLTVDWSQLGAEMSTPAEDELTPALHNSKAFIAEAFA